MERKAVEELDDKTTHGTTPAWLTTSLFRSRWACCFLAPTTTHGLLFFCYYEQRATIDGMNGWRDGLACLLAFCSCDTVGLGALCAFDDDPACACFMDDEYERRDTR